MFENNHGIRVEVLNYEYAVACERRQSEIRLRSQETYAAFPRKKKPRELFFNHSFTQSVSYAVQRSTVKLN